MKGYYTRYGYLAYSETADRLIEFASDADAIENDREEEEE